MEGYFLNIFPAIIACTAHIPPTKAKVMRVAMPKYFRLEKYMLPYKK
jgi:hypothetical protein